jgi:hypothetical protein
VKSEVVEGFLEVQHSGRHTVLELTLPSRLRTQSIPDEPGTVAFVHGPVVLAGLCDREITVHGDAEHPDSILAPDNERQWSEWMPGFRTLGQPTSLRFVPLHDVADQAYSVYFPVSGNGQDGELSGGNRPRSRT